MATFVLVHGAFHGGWCWKRVRSLLQRDGHEVYTPTLTGLGERKHLLTRNVGLETHIDDVIGVLEYEDLANVLLVGHSYGGMVITGVAGRLASRISQLIYLDAFVPRDGQAFREQFPPDHWPVIQARVDALGEGWLWVVPNAAALLAQFGVFEEDRIWMAERLCPQPVRTATDALRITDPRAAGVLRRTFISCTAGFGATGTYHGSEKIARADPNWCYRELPCGHDVMMTAPEALSGLLSELAAL